MAAMKHLSRVRLSTPRLILRDFAEVDGDAVQAYAGDPEVTRYTSWGPNSPDETAAVLAGWLAGQKVLPRADFTLAIERRTDAQVLGGIGFTVTDPSAGWANFGYVLRRSAWGHGYTTEAGRAVTEWATDELGLRRLVAHVEAANTASVGVLIKLGFLREMPVRVARMSGEERWYETFALSGNR